MQVGYKQMIGFLNLDLLELSSHREVFPGHSYILLALEAQQVFCLVVQRALRGLWLWFSALQIDVDRFLNLLLLL